MVAERTLLSGSCQEERVRIAAAESLKDSLAPTSRGLVKALPSSQRTAPLARTLRSRNDERTNGLRP